MSSVEHLIEKDKAHLIHPLVSLRGHEKAGPTILKSAEGIYVTDIEGHKFIDGFSGLWCVNAGYGQKSIIEAASRQLQELPYATSYFSFASEPTIELAARLAELAPGDLNHVFFTLGGSDAVDTTIRMVRYFFNTTGRPKKKHFISLDRSFHGSSTLGSGLTAIEVFHGNFDVPESWQHKIPSHYPYRNPAGPDGEKIVAATVAALEEKVASLGAENVAAFICEPVQGAGGVIIPPRGFLSAMRLACTRLDILFIVDEVITGFGRTGTLFACDAESVQPDLMTLAKGLTSGYAPMGAVMVSDQIYNGLADGARGATPFGHGLTYSGHPVSAAAGLAALDLYTNGGLVANSARMGRYFADKLRELANYSFVGDIRVQGLLGAIELVADKQSKQRPSHDLQLGQKLLKLCYERGLSFRALADDIIVFAPPLCITEDEIDLLVQRLNEGLSELRSSTNFQ